MGTMQWLAHFRDSAERTRVREISQTLTLKPALRAPIVQTLTFFQRALSTPGMDLRSKVRRSCDEAYVECVDHYVREKNVHADMLARVIWALGGEPERRNMPDFVFRRIRRRLDWQPELLVLLTGEMVMVPVMRVIANNVGDPEIKAVIEDILVDQAFHIGFHVDHLRTEVGALSSMSNVAVQVAWASMFSSALIVLLRECHPFFDAVGYSRLTCWTDAWHLFATVQAGLNGSDHLNSLLMRDPRLRFAL